MSVRARFYVSQFAMNAGDTSTVTLQAVCRGKEIGEWSKYTPAGSLNMTLTRAAGPAADFFKAHVGKDVFIDITPVLGDICTQCGEPIPDTPQSDTGLYGTNFQDSDGYVAGEFVHQKCVAAAKERLGIS